MMGQSKALGFIRTCPAQPDRQMKPINKKKFNIYQLLSWRGFIVPFLLFTFFLSYENKLAWGQENQFQSSPSPNPVSEVKRKTAAWVENRLNETNRESTQILVARLERLETILQKIETRAKKIETEKPTVSRVYPLIDNDRLKIDNLKLQLGEQKQKTYTGVLGAENTWRWQAGQSHQLLVSDLKNLRDKLLEIRKDMSDIVKILMSP